MRFRRCFPFEGFTEEEMDVLVDRHGRRLPYAFDPGTALALPQLKEPARYARARADQSTLLKNSRRRRGASGQQLLDAVGANIFATP